MKNLHKIAMNVALRSMRTASELTEDESWKMGFLLNIASNDLDTYEAANVLKTEPLRSRAVRSVLEEVCGAAAMYEAYEGQMHHDLVKEMKTWESVCKKAGFDWKSYYQKTLQMFS